MSANSESAVPLGTALSDEQVRQLLDAAPDAMIIVDSSGIIRLVNAMTERLFGFPRTELSGQTVEVLVPEAVRHNHHKLREHYMEQAEPRPMGSGLELFAVRRDGSQFPAEISLSPIRASGEMLVIAAVRDVTERKLAQQALEEHARELERSNAELQQFAYVASHDLQEPLRMVASYVQLLERRYSDALDDDAHEFMEYIVDGARRMQDLINDLLAFARVNTRGEELKATDANRVLKRVLDNLQVLIEDSHAKITSDELPVVLADAVQLMQLLQNLIGNALKFHGDEPPKIHIGVKQHDGEAVFEISDNGIGIDPQYAERVFQIFQRLHGKSEYGGTGIGLAICKKIVERHNGRIWLEPGKEKGTRFYFTLPLAPEGASNQ